MQMDQMMPLHTAGLQNAQHCEGHAQIGVDVIEIRGMSPVCIITKQQMSDYYNIP
jgi:hypothetical protein